MKNLPLIFALIIILSSNLYSQKTYTGRSPKKQVNLVSPNLVPPKLEIISIVFKDDDDLTVLKADKKGYVNIKVANKGEGTAYQVKVVMKLNDTEHSRNISLPSSRTFKVIEPNEDISVRFLVSANHFLKNGNAVFNIKVSEKYGITTAQKELRVNTKAFDPPNLVIKDIQFVGGSTVQIDVMTRLEAIIENKGLGEAQDVNISFSVPAGIAVIGERKFRLNTIEAGRQKKVSFDFMPREGYTKSEIPINYQVKESYNKYGLSSSVSVKLGAQTEKIKENINIVWINPNPDKKQNQSYTNKHLKIELKAVGNQEFSKNDFDIFINDYKIKINKSDEISLEGSTIVATVPLVEGQNDIQVRIGKYSSKTLTVYYSARKPNLYVLAFAPSYEVNNVSRTLKYTAKDAEAFIKTLKSQEGIIYNQVMVRKLYRNDAEANDFKANLERMTSQGILESDVFVLFASSHGMKADNENEFRLQGDDYDPGAPLTSTISSSFIAGQLRKLPCKKFLFIDACYSGGMGDKDDDNKKAINQTLEALTDAQSFMATFTSSSGSQKSYEHKKWEHGAFTKVLIDGLYGNADENNDRKITLNELNQYLQKQVPIIVGKEFSVLQVPNMFLKDVDGDLPFFVY